MTRGKCPLCLNPQCDAMRAGGSATATAAGTVRYLTPLQRVQSKLAETLELATTTLDEREHAAFVEILLARAASEGARKAWRQERRP